MQDTVHEVVVVGAGPVGLSLGRMLGLAGHEVVILERWPEPYPLPRAVHFDDEIARVFQNMGLAAEICDVSEPVPDHYEWRNAAGRTLVRIDWSGTGPCGWPTANFFCQPRLEEVLSDAVAAMDNVTLVRDAEVVGLSEDADEVEVTFTSGALERRRTRARYVVGCDGANSFVRERLGTTVRDRGFACDWLIVDTIPLDDRDWSPMNWQLCDPLRPTTVVSGGPGRRRWEFMRRPGETREQLNTPEMAWKLLEPWGRGPRNTELERHAVYTFNARWAQRWNRGRLIIAGDAAHQMPPFAGQGMCSGIRDVANLSWKLDRVLRSESTGELLDTYTTERRAHVQHAIAMSIELGRVICVLDETLAAQRDERMIAGGADPERVLPVTEKPVLGRGVTAQDIDVPALRGTLVPQFPVQSGGARDVLDELAGPGPLLLIRGKPPTARPDANARRRLQRAGVGTLSIGPTDACDLGDPTGEWTRWFDAHGIQAVLVRPDHYVFGAIADGADPSELAGQFVDRVGARPGRFSSAEDSSRAANSMSPSTR